MSKSVEPLLRNCDHYVHQNRHTYANCGGTEVAGDLVSGPNVKTVEWYIQGKFEFARSSSF